MDKQKQIEEMHQILLSAGYDWWKTYPNGKTKSEYEAECFYNAGFRKIPEHAVMMTRETYEKLRKGIKTYNYTAMFDAQNAYRWEQGYLQGCKETAEKFAEKLKDYINDKCCEELGDMACDTDYYTIDIPKTFDKIDEICKEITEV